MDANKRITDIDKRGTDISCQLYFPEYIPRFGDGWKSNHVRASRVCTHAPMPAHWDTCACVRASVRPCVRASVRPCVRASVRPCVRASVRPCVRASVRPCSSILNPRLLGYWAIGRGLWYSGGHPDVREPSTQQTAQRLDATRETEPDARPTRPLGLRPDVRGYRPSTQSTSRPSRGLRPVL